MRIAPEQVDRLLDWTARLRGDAAGHRIMCGGAS